MTATQLITFVVAPLTLLALGWAVAFAVDWKGDKIAEAKRVVLTEREAPAEEEAHTKAKRLTEREALAVFAEAEADMLKRLANSIGGIAREEALENASVETLTDTLLRKLKPGETKLTKDVGAGVGTLETLLEKLGVTKK
jgi:hypothetical protein